MSDATACIAAPLTSIECAVLRAYVEGDAAQLATSPAGWPEAAAVLHDRGMLGRTDRGILATPEPRAARSGIRGGPWGQFCHGQRHRHLPDQV